MGVDASSNQEDKTPATSNMICIHMMVSASSLLERYVIISVSSLEWATVPPQNRCRTVVAELLTIFGEKRPKTITYRSGGK